MQSIDFYPTLRELCGLPLRRAESFDGISIAPALRPALRGASSLSRETIFSHFPHRTPKTGAIPSSYVRRGDWKLIRSFSDRPDRSDRLELYNLRKDIGETVNVASDHPELTRALNRLLGRWLEQSQAVVPKPNPAYDWEDQHSDSSGDDEPKR